MRITPWIIQILQQSGALAYMDEQNCSNVLLHYTINTINGAALHHQQLGKINHTASARGTRSTPVAR
jgi:hypothetical protein